HALRIFNLPLIFSPVSLVVRIIASLTHHLPLFELPIFFYFFFFKQKTAYEIGLGIPAEPLFRSLQNTWPYGYSMPIAVRYTQDAFSRSGWLWPVDAKGEPLKATSYMAVGFYVAKYVNKKSDMDLAAKGLGAK